ncbi:hypothetical protein Hamer_G010365 [Homarus americanus]|uniref:Uncharacterized protein n=1 Tax=Homarus americanus TaxID=6706 RepID=A0A8J5K404_HOMAM|nr:hypothetical protein Hamer_G010365 [Homarus americanus]
MFRPVQEKEDSITIVLNEDKQEHDITVPIVHLEPETSVPPNIHETSSSRTYEVERCSSSNTRISVAATTEQRNRSHTPSATADDNQTRSTVTGDRPDELGSSPIPSTSHSTIRSDSRPQTTSGRKDEHFIPEMLHVQSQMRDSLVELVNSVHEGATQISSNMVKLVTKNKCIASALQTIAKAVQSKNPTP